jgi:hypothetical protein
MEPGREYVGSPATRPTPVGAVNVEKMTAALAEARKSKPPPGAGPLAEEVARQASRQVDETDEVATRWVDLGVNFLPVLGIGGAGPV